MVPADGVYAGWLSRTAEQAPGEPRRRMPAAVSVGTNPTFDGAERRVEAHVIGRTDLDLYGEEVLVEFVQRLRPTLRFDSVDDLLAAVRDDVARAKEVLQGAPAPGQSR
jgi:riboflavin kinase/FMN adenylyltransferase